MCFENTRSAFDQVRWSNPRVAAYVTYCIMSLLNMVPIHIQVALQATNQSVPSRQIAVDERIMFRRNNNTLEH